MKKILTVLKWTAIVMVAGFILLVIIRIPHAWDKQKTEEQVAKIHVTKLTLDDVMGKNLPPDPGANADKTVEGIDANNNGIRDDVELAIFKEYPNSAKTRAVLLQYALTRQMEMTQPLVNGEIVGAVATLGDAAFFCIASIVPSENKQEGMMKIKRYEDFVDARQLNTDARQQRRKAFYNYLESGSIGEGSCDISLNSLPN